jgi:hypothetical protein
MGGKALNKYGVCTKRVNTEEFYRISEEVSVKIFADLGMEVTLVKCYRNKPNHGDLDLLIKTQPSYLNFFNWKEYIKEAFNPRAINKNDKVYSFDYNDFQVDLILIPSDSWSTAQAYYSYDPLGNIMGKTYQKFGLSYGWEGLYYILRRHDGMISENILISRDIHKIFKFGGYDFDKYIQGFDTLEEIFMYCISSRYFDSNMFRMENLGSVDRKRNKKRGSYKLFLEYMEENHITKEYKFMNEKDYLPGIDLFFLEARLLNRINTLEKEYEKKVAASSKFNGTNVMSWFPGLRGEDLKRVTLSFKKHIATSLPFCSYDDYILNTSLEEIKAELSRMLLKLVI